MTGYPNVGKSSVINVLYESKKVGVAAQPGKTKNFQTLNVGADICLCDCPGLVFPTFAESKAEMVCCGVLPIDQLRNYVPSIELVVQRLPKHVLETLYKMKLPPQYTASQFLQIYAGMRGHVTGRGLPDEARTARTVLKDYVNGKLLFNHLRPDYNEETHGKVNQCDIKFAEELGRIEELKDGEQEQPSVQTLEQKLEAEFDEMNLGVAPQRKGQKKTKLTKAEKRALKFAEKKDIDAQEVDLSQVGKKQKHKTYHESAYGVKEHKMPTSNKFTHFAQMDLEN